MTVLGAPTYGVTGGCVLVTRFGAFQSAGVKACAAMVAAAILPMGCAEQPKPVAHTPLPVYQVDLQGGAASCQVTPPAPALADGQQSAATITVANDGGWCAISVAQSGVPNAPVPYSAGLLTSVPAHGKVLIHSVGDATRIDFTPERGATGPDAFTVRLVPGNAEIRVSVSVTPGPASAPPPSPPAPEKPEPKKRARS